MILWGNHSTTIHLPLFLNYGYHPTVPANLVHRNERTRQSLVQQFCKRRRRYWNISYEQRKRSIVVQSEYYEARCRSVHFNAGDLALLSTTHLKMKGVDNKLKRNMLGHFDLEGKLSRRVMVLSYPMNGACIMFSYLLALILESVGHPSRYKVPTLCPKARRSVGDGKYQKRELQSRHNHK